MIDVVTYESKNAKPNERWLAYAVLPNGSQWLVRCSGETEEIAVAKARSLYESERQKMAGRDASEKSASQEPSERVHHLAGKVWMINKATNHKVRIDKSEVEQYEWAGYVKGGPRS